MDTFSAIIIDDESKSRAALKALLNRYAPEVEVLGEADGFSTGIEMIKKYHPDVVFLDIQMPDGSGFRLLEEVGEINFDVIITTAYNEFAIKAIRFSALDYLMKPIVPEELAAAVSKLKHRSPGERYDPGSLFPGRQTGAPPNEPEKIKLSTADRIHIIEIDEILRCESDNYYTRFYFRDGSSLLISKTLKEHEELLGPHNFVRPHKSHLVNLKYVRGFRKHEGGFIVMSDGSLIPVSRRKREMIINVLNHL